MSVQEANIKVRYLELEDGGLVVYNEDVDTTPEFIASELKEKADTLQDCGIAVPVFFDKKQKIYFNGAYVLTKTLIPMPYASEEEDRNQYPDDRAVECSPLYFAYISPKLRKELPIPPDLGKDPFSDADYCLRAAELGYKTYVIRNVRVMKKHTYEDEPNTRKWMIYLDEKRMWFAKNWAEKLQNKRRLPIVLQSHTGFKGGYNMHARKLAEALVRKGIDMHYSFIGGSNADEPTTNNYLVDDLRNDYGTMDLPQIVLGVGELCFKNSGKYKIGFTTTEVDGIPKSWVDILNQMDEVWVTAEFCIEVFRKCGVKVPIFNMGEGIDPEYYNTKTKVATLLPRPRFVFNSVFAWGRRKGYDILIKAFQEEFAKEEDVWLVCNCLPSYSGHNILDEIKQMKLKDNRAPVTVIDKGLEDYEMPSFYASGDCFVLPTRGEGFGLPLLEALACGVPIITTGITGQLDYLTNNGKPKPGVHLISAPKTKFDGSDSVYYYGFNWTEPNKDELRKAMRYVFENAKAEKEKAVKTSEEIRKNWSWEAAADKVIDRIEKIYKEKMK
jgi:hypothetical protein